MSANIANVLSPTASLISNGGAVPLLALLLNMSAGTADILSTSTQYVC